MTPRGLSGVEGVKPQLATCKVVLSFQPETAPYLLGVKWGSPSVILNQLSYSMQGPEMNTTGLSTWGHQVILAVCRGLQDQSGKAQGTMEVILRRKLGLAIGKASA